MRTRAEAAASLVPSRSPSELPCVWVSAGVLSYRLCDREYECEDCPLYQALKGGARTDDQPSAPTELAKGEDLVGRYLADLGAGCTLHLDRPYTAEGLWLQAEVGGALQVGVDDYTLRLLQPLDNVVLPRPGVWLQRGVPCAWLNRGRRAIALSCPVACEISEVRPWPECARDGWWFRAIPHEPLGMVPGLHRNEALLSWFLGRVRAVHTHLSAVMHVGQGPESRPGLSDGGIPVRDLEKVLGRERFEALVGVLFPMQI